MPRTTSATPRSPLMASTPTTSESQAQGTANATARIQELGRAAEPYVIAQRRYFHQHPELSLQEVGTTEAIARELDAMRNLPGYDALIATCREHGVELIEAIASLTSVINIGKGMLAAAYCKEGPLQLA